MARYPDDKTTYSKQDIVIAQQITKSIRKYFKSMKFSDYQAFALHSSVSIDLVTGSIIYNRSLISHPKKIQMIFSVGLKDKQSDHDTYVNQMFTINFIGKQMFINNDLVFEFKTNRVEDFYATGETVTGFLADCICDTWDKQRTQSMNAKTVSKKN